MKRSIKSWDIKSSFHSNHIIILLYFSEAFNVFLKTVLKWSFNMHMAGSTLCVYILQLYFLLYYITTLQFNILPLILDLKEKKECPCSTETCSTANPVAQTTHNSMNALTSPACISQLELWSWFRKRVTFEGGQGRVGVC